MSLHKDQSVSAAVNSYILLTRQQKSERDNIRISANQITVLDDQGELIEQVAPCGKVLPPNLQNQQIHERSLLNSLDLMLKGMNLTVLLVGASFSGKERIFDGDKQQYPMVYHFTDRLFPALRQNYRRFEVRVKVGLMVKEKIYDCLSQNKYGTLKARISDWQGPEIQSITAVPIQTTDDLKREMMKAIKQKNKLVLQFKDLYSSILQITVIRDGEDGKIINTFQMVELPGVELLANNHSTLKHKQASLSTRSLLNVASIVNEYNHIPESIPETDSAIGTLLKQTICGNSHLVLYFVLRSQQIEGSRATLRLMQLFDGLRQYPIVNSANTFGLLRRFRAQTYLRRQRAADKQVQQEKLFLQNEVVRMRTQQDYTRLLQKYSELKNKYAQALKAKSQAQLQLIRCEQQKLQIGKSLVQVQIQNTKLLQKLQNKDYENGKKTLQVQNRLAQRQNNYHQSLGKIQQLTISLNQALQSRRDLQVQFVALKRNFIMLQKQVKQLKEDNQNLSLDVVNLSNQNQQLRKDWGNKNSIDDRSRLVMQMQNQKEDQLKRQNKRHQETITYLKGQIQRYRKEMVERQVGFQNKAKGSSLSGYGKDYDRLQLQNQNLELQNRVKILQRKVQQLDDRVGFYQQQNSGLQKQNQQQRAKQLNQTNQYRRKLEELTKGSNYQTIVKELKQNFMRKDTDNLQNINNLKKELQLKKRQIGSLKVNMRQLLGLLEQWSPKGADIPAIRKLKSIDFTYDGDAQEMSQLRIKNVRLQQQVRRLRASGGMASNQFSKTPTDAIIKESRVKQEYDYLRSNAGSDANRLRQQNNRLAQENRKLTLLLKDGNKMDVSVLRRQNQQLRRDVQQLKSNVSVSPSTNNQKLQYYQKYIKNLEKERSELLSRCTVAEEQCKNMLAKIGRVKP